MGASYTNITLKGPDQKQVGDFLDQENIAAYVAPAVGGITVVYDQASAHFDEALLTALAGKLSYSLDCVALAVSVYDSDILQYHLYLSGVLTDEYNSSPNYWGDEAEEISPTLGGDTEKLCAAFGAEDRISSVEEILRSHDSGYVFEEVRHADLADALSLPDYVVCAGFQTFAGDYAPEGLNRSSMRRTG